MTWADFRVAYSMKLRQLRDRTALHAESRLDIAERIAKPKLLADMVQPEALHGLQDALLRGVESRFNPPRPRSSTTVKTHMAAILAALRWAKDQGWIKDVPRVPSVMLEMSDDMKGRPLVSEEVDRLVAAVPAIVGEAVCQSWLFLLNDVLASGLRLSELMNISWDIPQTIRPRWKKGQLPLLLLPAHLQKNRKAQEIPLCLWFDDLLMEVPRDQRTGWVFNPASLQYKRGRKQQVQRLSAEWIGKIFSKVGRKAGVIVDESNARTEPKAKYASIHDLRRTFAVRLRDSDLPMDLVCKLMRHADQRTTQRYYLTENTQRDAGKIREILKH